MQKPSEVAKSGVRGVVRADKELIGDTAPYTLGLGLLISIGYRYSLANFHAWKPPIRSGQQYGTYQAEGGMRRVPW